MTARGRNRFMRRISGVITMYRLTFVVAALLVAAVTSAEDPPSPQQLRDFATAIKEIARGQETFRHDTFGNEAFWGGALRLHDAIAGGANGGSGTGLAPATALALGLKVDVDALPNNLRNALRKSRVDLGDPGTTLALLKLGAVVGVRGFFNDTGQRLESVGITCALCHSTVDESFAPGIGRRQDGWAARDLDVGAIIALAPNVQPFVDLLGLVNPAIDADTVRAVLRAWGPGKFDAELLMDGKAFRPDGKPAATLIPPAFGLAGVNLHTWTGWGSVTHWNGFVANLEMQGRGTFFDPRLNDAAKFPIAALAGFGDVRHSPDLVTPKLAALHVYQLSLPAPQPPGGSFDAAAATRGQVLFESKADCARCHVPPLYTEPGWNMHRPEEIGIDGFQAERSPDERYRTAPLKGLWTHAKGGYYHDGRFESLADVVAHYDQFFALALSASERNDIVEYLKSL
jgi:mono/diheme cytochrome c family protein